MSTLLVIGRILVFLLLAVGMYFLVKRSQTMNLLEKVRKKVDDFDRKRLLPREENNFFERYLERLDEHLTQAGLKKYLPKAGVEIYFACNVLEFTLIFILVGEGILIPLGVAGLAIYCNKLLLDLLRYRNKRITEKHLLELLNLISDYAMSESEITMILYRCGRMLPNPLRMVLTKCHLSARSTGNTKLALYELRRSIDHFLFREILLLLELCGRGDNDYQKAVTGCREMVNRYLKEEKEKAGVVRSLIGEAALMSGVAGIGIHIMLREFATEAGFSSGLVGFFLYDPVGQICAVLYGVLLFAMVQVILKFAKG